ncbi:hypothetical protein ACIBUY_04250 [Streptomyces sp. NPDC050085]|uniref:hypothetical protein n=1 Tax=Streptomyces sp. NPDC050085 TaxID=3365600 RepID=UPI0037A1DFEF
MSRRLRRPAALLALACTLLPVAACSNTASTPPSHTSATASSPARAQPAPALSRTQARTVLTHYSKINNKAGAALDATLLDTVEDGPQLAMTRSWYTQERALPELQRTPYIPWSYDADTARYFIPRLPAGRQRWFAAQVFSGTATEQSRLLVVAERPRTHAWELVEVVDLADATALKVAEDRDGYATAVDATSSARLAAPVSLLRTAVLDNVVTGGANTGHQVFASTPAIRKFLAARKKTLLKYGPQGTVAFAPATTTSPQSYALKMADGSVLVAFAHRHTQTDTVTRAGLGITPAPEDRAWLGTNSQYTSITYTFTCADAALVPSTSRQANLLGSHCARTDAEGTPASRRAA